MRRSHISAVIKTAIISSITTIGAILVFVPSSEGSTSSTPSAITSGHKESRARTSSLTVIGTRTTSGTSSSQRVFLVRPKPTPTPAPTRKVGITMPSAAVMAQWQKVAICEEGGNWHVRGSLYSGGLGIRNSNWTYYSRGLGFPASAADAAPWQQVIVAQRIQGSSFVPDQYGCAAW